MPSRSSSEDDEKESSVIGRPLFHPPVLWRDWDEDAADSEAKYWELFTDLLMVAAATSMVDNFKESPNLHGLVEFALTYSAVANGWLYYTPHYTSRFLEPSLVHSVVLFFFVFGMAASIVNAGFETAVGFSISVVIQRLALLAIMAPVPIFIPRAKAYTWALCRNVIFSIVFFGLVAVLGEGSWTVVMWTGAFIADNSLEFFMVRALPGRLMVPINVEHTIDRLGVMVLVMLGETVISSTITYREYRHKEHLDDKDDEAPAIPQQYYVVLFLAFLLIYMFCLIYFNMQPPRHFQGLRRNRWAGSLVMISNKLLGCTLLAMGATIKLSIEAVVEERGQLSLFTARLMGCSVGTSLLLMYFQRIAHYGGRVPGPNHPDPIRLLFHVWWVTFAIACLLPFLFLDTRHSVQALAIYSGILMGFCLVDNVFSHYLQEYVPKTPEELLVMEDHHGDSSPLTAEAVDLHSEYQSIDNVTNRQDEDR